SAIAATTYGGINDPPSRVNVADALITRRTPRSSYLLIALSSPCRSRMPDARSRTCNPSGIRHLASGFSSRLDRPQAGLWDAAELPGHPCILPVVIRRALVRHR